MGFKIFVMGYNPILCDLKLLLVIWVSRAEFQRCNFFCYANVLIFYVLGLDSCIVAGESIFGLDVVYCSGYFYDMCCKCDDTDGYMHRHRSAQHKKIWLHHHQNIMQLVILLKFDLQHIEIQLKHFSIQQTIIINSKNYLCNLHPHFKMQSSINILALTREIKLAKCH
jgi:hypothetical protein